MNRAVTAKPDTNEGNALLARTQELAVASSKAASRFGAQLVVHYSFIEAVLPMLNAQQRRQVEQSFRREIEDLMSRTDDVPMPPEYHAALLSSVNELLQWLRSPDLFGDF